MQFYEQSLTNLHYFCELKEPFCLNSSVIVVMQWYDMPIIVILVFANVLVAVTKLVNIVLNFESIAENCYSNWLYMRFLPSRLTTKLQDHITQTLPSIINNSTTNYRRNNFRHFQQTATNSQKFTKSGVLFYFRPRVRRICKQLQDSIILNLNFFKKTFLLQNHGGRC